MRSTCWIQLVQWKEIRLRQGFAASYCPGDNCTGLMDTWHMLSVTLSSLILHAESSRGTWRHPIQGNLSGLKTWRFLQQFAFSGSNPASPWSHLRIPGLFWAHSHKDFELWFCKDFTVKISWGLLLWFSINLLFVPWKIAPLSCLYSEQFYVNPFEAKHSLAFKKLITDQWFNQWSWTLTLMSDEDDDDE